MILETAIHPGHGKRASTALAFSWRTGGCRQEKLPSPRTETSPICRLQERNSYPHVVNIAEAPLTYCRCLFASGMQNIWNVIEQQVKYRELEGFVVGFQV